MSEVHVPLLLLFGSAPLSNNKLTISVCPINEAYCNIDHPSMLHLLISIPLEIHFSIVLVNPKAEAVNSSIGISGKASSGVGSPSELVHILECHELNMID